MPRGSCEDGTTCSYFDENPAGGLQSFDSVAWAFVTILQVMTFDTWTDAMFGLMNGFSYNAWIYFVAIAVLGGLFGYAIGFFLFDKIGQPILDFYGVGAEFEHFKQQFNAQGWIIVLLAGFTPLPFKVITIAAGATVSRTSASTNAPSQ